LFNYLKNGLLQESVAVELSNNLCYNFFNVGVGTMLRIISGEFGGRKIKTLPGRDTRPTSDRVREALFNVLQPRLKGCNFLDLYAGSGAIGIEALSRGAARAVFIEANSSAIKVIRENLTRLSLLDRAEVIWAELPAGLDIAAARAYKFDLIFMDPPYWQNLVEPILIKLGEQDLLAAQGWVVAETAAREPLPAEAGNLACFREKRYGDTRLSYYSIQ
jgi:16S rRNA (guanine(966)-N(2))-methyltransferase RsmD